jgi:hypothetical protein
VESCGHDVAHLESFCEGRLSLDSLGGGYFIERDKLLACELSPSLYMELA